MTATPDREQTNAAVVFTGLMTLAAGGAGLVLAGLIVGFDHLLHGEPGEREKLAKKRAERRRDRYADALAWLEADRIDRTRTRAAVREWFEADRDTRGDRPTGGETAGRFAARLWNGMLVGAFRFRNGWKSGRDEARTRRAAGDERWWWPTEGSRPVDEPVEPNGEKGTGPAPAAEAEPDVIDAEIVADPAPQVRPLVPVGVDEPAPADGRTNGHEVKLQALRAEVDHTRSSRNDDPSPPLTALR